MTVAVESPPVNRLRLPVLSVAGRILIVLLEILEVALCGSYESLTVLSPRRTGASCAI